MSVDVDAVSERLNGLVTLLKAVGVDSGDVAGITKGLAGGTDARQLNDDQIEAIIRKLQQAQAEAPQIIAALEAQAAVGKNKNNANNNNNSKPAPNTAPPEPEVDEDEDDDSEGSDEGNYPMVGHGISDDISVVSDLTTPTVLQGVPVPEEEHYRDTLPPMIIGGGPGKAPPMVINPTKRKNLVNQVQARPGLAGPPRRTGPAQAPTRPGAAAQQPAMSNSGAAGGGGAAAQRRNKYNNVVAKLATDAPPEKPVRQASMKATRSVTKKVPPPSPSGAGAGPGAAGAGGEKKVIKKKLTPRAAPTESASSRTLEVAWEPPQASEWNAFESKPPTQGKSPTVIDNDGFLVGDAGFNPFGAGVDPFSSSPSSPAGDLAFAKSHAPVKSKSVNPSASRPSAAGALAAPSTDHPRRPRPSQQKVRPTSEHNSSTSPHAAPSSQQQQQHAAAASSGNALQPLRKPKGTASVGRRTPRRASLV